MSPWWIFVFIGMICVTVDNIVGNVCKTIIFREMAKRGELTADEKGKIK